LLFLTHTPIDHTTLFTEWGPDTAAKMGTDVAEYNAQLTQSVRTFKSKHPDLDTVTGYCEAYENGTPTTTYQVEGCAPVSNHFWLNGLHPLFTVHNILAKGISTALSGYPATQTAT
ncbi:uncharacterized protein F5891DRAFT_963221, partial [Suillus fuscotomentosus]